jgi:hypothetical protein
MCISAKARGVAQDILAGDFDSARKRAFRVRAWTPIDVRAIESACAEARSRYNIPSEIGWLDFTDSV